MLGPDGCLATVLGEGDGVTLRVAGGCMAPGLSHGSSVRVERRRLLPGDVVAYSCPWHGRMVVHRLLAPLWRPGGWKLMTMADQAARPDALVDPSQVLGRVTAIDGTPYRPGLGRRVCAVVRFVCWCMRLGVRRLVGQVVTSRSSPSSTPQECVGAPQPPGGLGMAVDAQAPATRR